MTEAKKRVLIVEDEKELMKALELKFTKEGFDVTSCYDGQQAIDMLKEKEFDVVLLDIIMPVKDGFSVLQERSATKNATTPICVLTAMGQEENLQKAAKLGAKQCYVKSNSSIADILKGVKQEIGMS